MTRFPDRPDGPPSTVVFYDGVCGLCNRLVQFLLVRDRRGVLHFAPLQGELAGAALARHGVDPADLDSVVVVSDWGLAGERADTRAAAVLEALERLGGGWRLAARAGRIVPRTLADLVYRAVARSRYRIFGRLDTCPLPRPEWKDRFLR
jgi:predicted DCC family thiol-disulfide oxidoreductase YuxK